MFLWLYPTLSTAIVFSHIYKFYTSFYSQHQRAERRLRLYDPTPERSDQEDVR